MEFNRTDVPNVRHQVVVTLRRLTVCRTVMSIRLEKLIDSFILLRLVHDQRMLTFNANRKCKSCS